MASRLLAADLGLKTGYYEANMATERQEKLWEIAQELHTFTSGNLVNRWNELMLVQNFSSSKSAQRMFVNRSIKNWLGCGMIRHIATEEGLSPIPQKIYEVVEIEAKEVVQYEKRGRKHSNTRSTAAGTDRIG